MAPVPRRRPGALLAAVVTLVVGGLGVVAVPTAVQARTTTTPQTATTQRTPTAPPPVARAASPTTLVSTDPDETTPQTVDGEVDALAQVGDRIVVGGTFTAVRSSVGPAAPPRSYLFAYDRRTGLVDTGFAPVLNGPVATLAASPDGTTVVVGGGFTKVGTTTAPYLVRLDVATGARVTTFAPGLDGRVSDVEVHGSALYVTGWFTHVAGAARVGLARLSVTTGANSALALPLATTRAQGGVRAVEVSPDGARLVLAGNFTSVGGVARDQLAVVDLTTTPPSVRADWRTTALEFTHPERTRPGIATYVRDLAMSGDGSWFGVATTWYYPGNGDSVSRWDTRAAGADLAPAWIRYTGSDTVTALTLSPDDRTVYIGGHFRWVDALPSNGHDPTPPGRISRWGLAALDAATGMARRWAPTRERGYGVLAMLVDSSGSLVVGHDTATVAQQPHSRLATFPAAGGRTVTPAATPLLPVTVSTVGSAGQVATRVWSGTAVTATGTAAFTLPGVRAATPVGPDLLAVTQDGFVRLEGDHAGRWVLADRLYVPGLAASSVTGVAVVGEHLYYTVAGGTSLLARAFSTDSWLAAPTAVTVSGPAVDGRSWSDTTGLFAAAESLWQAGSGGVLRRVTLAPRTTGAAAVSAVATVSGPALDGRSWAGALVGAGAPAARAYRRDLALGAPVSGGPAATANLARAVDGDRDGSGGAFAAAAQGTGGAWVQVDLGAPRAIDAVRIWCRPDDQVHCASPTVLVSDTPFSHPTIAGIRDEPGVVSAAVVGLPGAGVEVPVHASGRFVRVMVPPFEDWGLALAELEVLAPAAAWPAPVDGEDVARAQPATLSSEASRLTGAANAVDGVRSAAVAVSGTTTTPWLQVDLGRTVPVGSVRVTARPDCCVGRLDTAVVLLSTTPFTSTDPAVVAATPGVTALASVGVPTAVLPAGVSARYVRLQLTGTGDDLGLSELEVLAGTGPAQPVRAGPVTGLGVPALWLDAASPSTVLRSGSVVTGWLDRSGRGRTMLPDGTGVTWSATALDGRPAVVTSGTSVLATGAAFGPTSTVLVVARPLSTGAGRVLGGVRTDWAAGWSGGREAVATLGAPLRTQGPAATTAPHLVTVVAGDGSATLRQDGAVLATSPGGYLSPRGLQVGGGCCGTGVGGATSASAVAEVIVYDRRLTDAETAAAEAYLAARWGLRLHRPRTGGLPATGRLAGPRRG